MDRTIEVRWWFAGTLPDDILAWFRSRGHAQADRRTDHYLVRPALPETGVKCRAGERLEVKVRTGRHEGLPLGPGVGHVEWWAKYAFGLHPDQPSAGPLRGPEWVAVDKQRWVHDRGGCAVELAVVAIGGEGAWWSLCLEAPADTHGTDDLDRVLTDLFAVRPPRPIPLEPELSRGYSEHLARHRSGADPGLVRTSATLPL